MSLFTQVSNKNSIKKHHKRNTHTQHKENIKIIKTRKNYKVKEFTNVIHISNLIFVVDKVQVEMSPLCSFKLIDFSQVTSVRLSAHPKV